MVLICTFQIIRNTEARIPYFIISVGNCEGMVGKTLSIVIKVTENMALSSETDRSEVNEISLYLLLV